jgi:dUTP pyrophosphatase
LPTAAAKAGACDGDRRKMHVRIRRLDGDLPLPAAQHPDDAGYDLHAAVDAHIEAAGGRALVPTGIAIAVPSGSAGFVLPRSGLALNHGVTCLNTPGLIDPLYRGEVKVLLVNTDSSRAYDVNRGDRIAQLVLLDVEMIEWLVVDELGSTERNTFGFGSTGS